MTVAHFGLCDWSFYKIQNHKFSVSLTHGMVVIFGIIYFNEKESFKIFEYLTNSYVYNFESYMLFFYILTIFLITYFIILSIFEKKLRKGIFEIAFLLTIFYFLDPILSFAIYFCFFHTLKHLKHLINNVYLHLSNKKFVLISTVLFTLVIMNHLLKFYLLG